MTTPWDDLPETPEWSDPRRDEAADQVSLWGKRAVELTIPPNIILGAE